MELSRQVFDKTFDGVVKALPLNKTTETLIISAKNVLENDVVQEKIKSIFDGLFNKNSKVINSVEDVKSIFQQEGIIKEISETIETVVNSIKKDKIIDFNTAKLLYSGKELIVDKLIRNETQKRFDGQEKVLEKIDEQYTKWEQAFNANDTKTMDKTYKQIEKQYEKLLPTIQVIEKVNEIKNVKELAKNKLENGINEISDMEKEICRKVG